MYMKLILYFYILISTHLLNQYFDWRESFEVEHPPEYNVSNTITIRTVSFFEGSTSHDSLDFNIHSVQLIFDFVLEGKSLSLTGEVNAS